MKHIINTSIVFFLVLLTGCMVNVSEPDTTPPAIPRGLYTIAGDRMVELFWVSNTERDFAGYYVYVSSSYDGRYQRIGSTNQNYYVDRGVRNGHTYYYAISAYDINGNESDLSPEVACVTPRPEGYGVILRNYRADPNHSGYDFSTSSVGRYNDQYTDVFFEYYNGVHYLNVWEDTDIQDMGYTNSLYDIVEAPTRGWTPTKDVVAIPGHTYVIWTWDNHFAKIRVTEVSSARVKFDWAYQLQTGNPSLKMNVKVHRDPLQMGSGAKSRK